ncbi:MAG: site-2 protease family protein [Candidatus Dadabacteria bacterium]|nr:MAG: site-2 protease family protein [Candidatus Dadabacteria bacterium]
MQEGSSFITLITAGPALLIAVVLHEIAHGYVAERFGDPTARLAGRLTLNPIKHIDLFMTIIVPAVLIVSGSPIIFGGAKPVPVDPRNFDNPKRAMGWVAVAGPVTNFVLALIAYILLRVVELFDISALSGVTLTGGFILFLIYSIIINVILAVFNLIPVPPLDGGRIAVALLPLKAARPLARLEPFGLLIVVALLFSGVLQQLLGPVLNFVMENLIGIS